MRVWRLCQAAYAKKALTGEEAFTLRGRWHLQGVRVVYAAATLSLAALELLVRIDRELAPPDLKAVEIDIPDSVEVERVPLSKLPSGWDAYPGLGDHTASGHEMDRRRANRGLGGPSAVIPREHNYVLNAIHPQFKRLRTVATTPFAFDSRLLTLRPRLTDSRCRGVALPGGTCTRDHP